MEPQRWETLQFHLTAGRVARDVGDRDQALEHIDAALAIDPDFLAAQLLRQSVLASPEPKTAEPSVESVPLAPAASAPAERPIVRPQVSAGGYAQLEERVRRRRIDRCIGLARSAIVEGRLRDAAAALDEVHELDPDLPALKELTAELASLRPIAAGRHLVPWIGAAAVLVTTLLVAWPRPQKLALLLSDPIASSVPLVTPPAPLIPAEAVTPPPVIPPAPTIPIERASSEGPSSLVTTRAAGPETNIGPAGSAIVPPRPEVRQPVRDVPAPISERAPPPPVVAERAAEPFVSAQPVEPAAVPPAARAAAPAVATPLPVADDSSLVRETLQRYRRAYNGLDAQLAHAVYPVLDQAALAHAFATLRSQSLEFDSCSVDVRGESARAVCRGSARYVPNIGSRTPRTERRVWTFTLEKMDGGWKIASARTER